MKPRIVVIGSSNTDMVVQTPSLPAPGQTVLGGEFLIAAGGKGANQAVAARRLGAEVALVARVGTDMFGEQSLEGFRADGIVTDYIVRDQDNPSGVALIMVDEAGENMITVASGANAALSIDDIRAARRAVQSASVVLLQLEIPLETVRFAARMAKEAGASVILNPAPAQLLDSDLLGDITILTPNESETEMLTGTLPVERETARRAAEVLLDNGVKNVVITMGEEGAFLFSGDESEMVPAAPVKAVDSTAAGDAFNGALAYSLASGEPLQEAVRFANRVAAVSVTRAGAQPSLPYLAEIKGS